MLQSWIENTVGFCIRYSRSVILAGLIIAAASAVYAGRHFAINTDINDLISAQLPWRQHEIDFQRAFPQTVELIIADVHAPTPEAVKAAARELEKALADKPSLFHSVTDQFDSPFFRRNGLLYLPPERIEPIAIVPCQDWNVRSQRFLIGDPLSFMLAQEDHRT